MREFNAKPEPASRSEKVPVRVWGVMTLTAALTFTTLTTGYQLFFQHQLYA